MMGHRDRIVGWVGGTAIYLGIAAGLLMLDYHFGYFGYLLSPFVPQGHFVACVMIFMFFMLSLMGIMLAVQIWAATAKRRDAKLSAGIKEEKKSG
jgi:hypothetical protein